MDSDYTFGIHKHKPQNKDIHNIHRCIGISQSYVQDVAS